MHLPLDEPVRRQDLGEGCELVYWPRFVDDAEGLRDRLIAQLPWLQELYPRAGRLIPAPRLTSFHGEPGTRYAYSGMEYDPHPFDATLEGLRSSVNSATGYAFNSVLANLYRDGRDSVGFHSDDEPELGPSRQDIAIGSLSLGGPRRFVLRHKRRRETVALELASGSLLLMRGRTQLTYTHTLPKTARAVDARVNLTFRVIRLVAPAPGRTYDGTS